MMDYQAKKERLYKCLNEWQSFDIDLPHMNESGVYDVHSVYSECYRIENLYRSLYGVVSVDRRSVFSIPGCLGVFDVRVKDVDALCSILDAQSLLTPWAFVAQLYLNIFDRGMVDFDSQCCGCAFFFGNQSATETNFLRATFFVYDSVMMKEGVLVGC